MPIAYAQSAVSKSHCEVACRCLRSHSCDVCQNSFDLILSGINFGGLVGERRARDCREKIITVKILDLFYLGTAGKSISAKRNRFTLEERLVWNRTRELNLGLIAFKISIWSTFTSKRLRRPGGASKSR